MARDLKKWAKNTRKYHRSKGFEVRLSTDEIIQMGLKSLNAPCPYCGRIIRNVINQPNSLSLDVIDPNYKIIDKYNCRIICIACNCGKMARTEREYVKHCKNVVMTLGVI